MIWHQVAEISAVIVNGITISIPVPIIASILFTTSIHDDVLSYSLKFNKQYSL